MTTLVRTRHEYGSYVDFWRLVDAAQLPTCYVDEIDPADDTKTYIFTPINGEVMHRLESWKTRRAKIVWWNLERPTDDTLSNSLDKVSGSLDGIWVSDRIYAQLDARFTYVPVAGHQNFGTRSEERHYDVCHLAYLWGRRLSAIRQLEANGIKIAPEAYGREAQDQVVAKSRLMLNLHQYDGATVAPIRFAVAASYGIPVITESVADPLASLTCMSAAPLSELIRRDGLVERFIGAPDILRSFGDRLFVQLCVNTDFRHEVLVASGKLGR